MSRASILVAMTVVLLSSRPCFAEAPVDDAVSPAPVGRVDYLFPRRGELSMSLGTGIPFLAIGELAYGVGDGFAVGGLAAATPDVGDVQGTAAIGARPRGILVRAGRWRSVVVAPVLYYPSFSGFGEKRDPWVLTRPEITLERASDSGAQVNVALGLVAAACTESLMTLGREHSPTVMGGVWNTVRIGGAIPIAHRASVFGEASLVLRGVRPASDWMGAAPAIAIVGVTVGL